MIELSLQKGSEEIMKYLLIKEITTIGRAAQNDICLPDPNISRVHVTIVRKANRYVATDKSTNGTLVNGKQISSCELKPDDVIKIGAWSILFAADSSTEEADLTDIEARNPTKVLSYKVDKNEIVIQQPTLEMLGPRKKSYRIGKSIFSIGKAKSNDVCLSDDFVSNHHCKIENRKGVYYIKDLNSTNGTLLNGQKVIETTLPFGSEVQIGQTKFQFLQKDEAQEISASEKTEFERIISKNKKMRQVFALLERVSDTEASILVQGESGTGKELIARAVHKRSSRSRRPFVAVNCAAISKDLIESELFGHEKGAFTSAHQQRRGVFEQANGGTLFLDEIGELPLDLQPKLLRALETGEIKRVGGAQLIDVDVRVVAATNRDLAVEVSKGSFREDLFYRLFVVPIYLPPLRERREDIPLLVNHFMRQEFAPDVAPNSKTITSAAMDRLVDHPWPGNVRELRNVISRAVLECQTDIIDGGDLQFAPIGVREQTAHEFDETLRISQPVARTLREVERERILTELKRHQWNKKLTADSLGIARSTLHEKIRKYGLKEGD